MALFHPDPFREVQRFLDRSWQEACEQEDQEIEVAVDVFRRGRLYWVEMDLPAVAPHRIDVVIEGRALSVRARRFADLPSPSATSLLYERPRGSYRRTVTFDENLDGSNAHATYDGGVLHLSIPSALIAVARRIQVPTAGDGPTQVAP